MLKETTRNTCTSDNYERYSFGAMIPVKRHFGIDEFSLERPRKNELTSKFLTHVGNFLQWAPMFDKP